MIDALVAGKLFGTAVERTSRNGNSYVTAKVRAPTRDGESQFVNLVGFSNTVVAALVALEDGDAIAVSGELSAKAYTSKAGEPKPSLELLVQHVLTEFHVLRKRRAAVGSRSEAAAQDQLPLAGPEASETQEERSSQHSSSEEFDDDIPF